MNVKKWNGSMASLLTGINPVVFLPMYIGYRPTYVVHTHQYILYIHPLHTRQQLHLPAVFPCNKLPANKAALMAPEHPDSHHATRVILNSVRICIQDVVRLLLQYTL